MQRNTIHEISLFVCEHVYDYLQAFRFIPCCIGVTEVHGGDELEGHPTNDPVLFWGNTLVDDDGRLHVARWSGARLGSDGEVGEGVDRVRHPQSTC